MIGIACTKDFSLNSHFFFLSRWDASFSGLIEAVVTRDKLCYRTAGAPPVRYHIDVVCGNPEEPRETSEWWEERASAIKSVYEVLLVLPTGGSRNFTPSCVLYAIRCLSLPAWKKPCGVNPDSCTFKEAQVVRLSALLTDCGWTRRVRCGASHSEQGVDPL